MEEQTLLELFSIPIGLKPKVKIDDVQLYGSTSLDKNYKKSIAKSETASYASAQISRLVDNGMLNACYLNKGIIRVLLWKVLVIHPIKSILAFFAPHTNKIYILIDNNISIVGYIPNKFLGNLTIHETCHMGCFNDYMGFFNIFSQDLINYYSNYFKILFKLDEVPEKKVKDFAFSLVKSETQKVRRTIILPVIETFLESLRKYFKGTTEEFDRLKNMYLFICRVIMSSWNEQSMRDIMNSRDVIAPLYKSYRESFGFRTRHILHCQEVVTASEVICVYSEIAPHDKIVSMLSLIK
jgi:hypothetical protein